MNIFMESKSTSDKILKDVIFIDCSRHLTIFESLCFCFVLENNKLFLFWFLFDQEAHTKAVFSIIFNNSLTSQSMSFRRTVGFDQQTSCRIMFLINFVFFFVLIQLHFESWCCHDKLQVDLVCVHFIHLAILWIAHMLQFLHWMKNVTISFAPPAKITFDSLATHTHFSLPFSMWFCSRLLIFTISRSTQVWNTFSPFRGVTHWHLTRTMISIRQI